MKAFVVLHVEDDNDYNFLFSQYLKDPPFSVLWGMNRKETLLLLEEHKVDAIVFDGEIRGWEGHIDEVLALTKNIPFIILSGMGLDRLLELKRKGYAAHQKGHEGICAVVKYIKELAEK
jgi:response regulator RpfG family c-di-GMP phosphodiesterase